MIETKSDLNSLIFLGTGRVLIADILSSNGDIPDFVIPKANHTVFS